MDPIANMLVTLKNGGEVAKTSVSFPYSKVKSAILDLLQKEGYVKSIQKKGKKNRFLEVELAYVGKEPRIHDVQRISKFSRRIYSGAKNLKPHKEGFGITVLTTPKGIVTDKEAKKLNVGGEVLFKIW